jgi:glycosyltransferase involved in cell wall biosynthesis
VVTVSEFSRRELRELLGVDAVVVPGGVEHERFHPGAGGGAGPVGVAGTGAGPAAGAGFGARVRGGVGAGPAGYVLTVGARTARKNVGALGETARRLRSRGVELWAAGGDRPQFAGEDVPGVRWLGHVPDADLPALYARARAFVLPSLHEGFGLPVLEAMACGVPVVAARAGALPETCGDAARLADPRDPGALATAVEEVLDDPAPWRAAGLVRAAQFSWGRTASAVDALLHG